MKNKNIILLFDVDGVLVPYNQKTVPISVKNILRKRRVIKVLASGKNLKWCWEIGEQICADAVFAENGLVSQFRGKPPQMTADVSHLEKLRELIHFTIVNESSWTAMVSLGGTTSQMIFEPGKTILTLWADPRGKVQNLQSAPCAWSEEQFVNEMRRIIKENLLDIVISGPYRDGGIDFQLVGIDKGKAVDMLRILFPDYKIIVFADDHNDLPMLLRSGVFAVTFANGSKEVKEIVEERQRKGMGFITNKRAFEGGLEEALDFLLKRNKGGKRNA